MTAFYPGSFDPFTIGHLSIARRALEIFPRLIIGIGVNKAKTGSESIDLRIRKIQKVFEKAPEVTVFAYEGLTAPIARENGAGVLVRGVRNSIDFEKEKELADINLKVFGMPTIFIPAEPELSFVSSSMVRELAHFGFDPSPFLPSR
ncbi:MAG: pantetheine-phosphate adenylyltransferase [Muribaculaceae bacterium]|nr:pantetheine-phosphate adenylyltransferase [Muribaculaceae bacterium]